ncbi:MAG: lipoyl(octanoyl) transferase LipB [Spirochaetia bacterium]|jgi:lipoyl(octanoyl) transferase|nr:lipoyl(octanoyl) transferase LipB [Spirochaetia bacterium]
MKLNIVRLGKTDYLDALRIQEALLEKRQNNIIENTLLIVEHYPVLTIGISGKADNIIASRDHLEKNGIKVYQTTRGGDVTYHGPGQIVGYPVIDLKNIHKGVKDFIILIQEVFIRLLKNEYNIEAEREEGKYTGVWTGGDKITAIGIAVKKWVTMHGFAFNINTNLDHFRWINPCGITDKGVTSLEKLTGEKQDFDHLNDLTAKYFCEVFGFKEIPAKLEEL